MRSISFFIKIKIYNTMFIFSNRYRKIESNIIFLPIRNKHT